MPQLETALIVKLRDTLPWESALAPKDVQTQIQAGTYSGTYSGTLTMPDLSQPFNQADYQRRDRELAWFDTRTAAAVVEVSIEVGDVWNADVTRPIMQGPQVPHLTYNPQDVSAAGTLSRVVHVKNASIPLDALQVDRDLCGRDILVYETLFQAVANLFEPPPITSSGAAITPVTAWSFAEGTAMRADISSNLALNKPLFKNPDSNLADRDNQLAGYTAQLCQILKNPFAFADRLYVGVYGPDSREVETYTLIEPLFVPGTVYDDGDQVYYLGSYYQVIQGTGSTTDPPITGGIISPAWQLITGPTLRTWTCEPALSDRNRFVYNTSQETLQWFRETASYEHVPQLVALSIPGIFSGQTITTEPEIPERKDGQFWRNKAAHIVPEGAMLVDLVSLDNLASQVQKGFKVTTEGVALTIPSSGSVWFPDPFNPSYPQPIAGGNYRISALVKPSGVLEFPAGENNNNVGGTGGGATLSGYATLTYSLGLPPVGWTLELDYTNLSGSTNGFTVSAQIGNVTIFENAALYFIDANGQPVPNGTLVTSPAFPFQPSGQADVLSLSWTGGTGQLHIRTIRLKTAVPWGHYEIVGNFAGQTGTVDVIGQSGVPGVMNWDFTIAQSPNNAFNLMWNRDSQLPIAFLRMDLGTTSQSTPTPNSQGFENYRQDCLVRAVRSAKQSFNEAFYSNTEVTFNFAGTWDSDSTERWMALIESTEPRLRELKNIPSDSVVPDRQYYVAYGSLTYEGNTYQAGSSFLGNQATSYSWLSNTGQVNQTGAWLRSKATHNGRPCLAPAGVYFDYQAGTMTAAYSPERTTPELVTTQPWMIEQGFYAAQAEFWLPRNIGDIDLISVGGRHPLHPVPVPIGIDVGLIANFRLDESTGFLAHDSSPNQNNFALSNVGGPIWGPGQIGGCYNPNAYNVFYQVASSTLPIFRSLLTGYSISLWFKGITGYAGGYIFAESSTTHSSWMGLYQPPNTNQIAAYLTINGTNRVNAFISSAALLDGNWHHVVLTDTHAVPDSSHNTWTLYVDGVATGSVSYVSSDITPSDFNATALGGAYGSPVFDKWLGSIDEVRLYNRILSTSEITTLYNSGASGILPPSGFDIGMVARWALDETSGNTAYDSTTNANNLSVTPSTFLPSVWGPGHTNNAFTSNGSQGFTPPASPIDLPLYRTTGWATAFWFKAAPAAGTVLGDIWWEFSKTSGNNSNFDLHASNGHVYLVAADSTGTHFINVSTNAVVQDGSWHHIVFSDSSGQLTCYVDNVVDLATSYNPSVVSNYRMDLMSFCCSTNTDYNPSSLRCLNAGVSVDEVRLYNRPLSADDVAQLFAS